MFMHITSLKYKLPDGNWWFGHISIDTNTEYELPTKETVLKGNFWFSKDNEGWHGDATLENKNLPCTKCYVFTDLVYTIDIHDSDKWYNMGEAVQLVNLPKQTARIEDCVYRTTKLNMHTLRG